MRDLERKVNRFVNEKSVGKNRVASPMTHSIFSPSTATNSNKPQSATKVVKKVNNRTFSMTVVFSPQVTNPRFENLKSKDISIKHEENKQRSVTSKPVEQNKSPRRNPITQDSQEPCYEFKAPFKATPLTGKMTMFNEEESVKKRADGEYKVASYRSMSPNAPVPCIKTSYSRAMREDQEPEPRRLRKGPTESLKNLLNPIVEGDLESLKFKRVRKAALSPGPSEETKKFNDKNQLLATDIGYSPKGRVFRETSLVDFAHSIQDPAVIKSRRHASPEFQKPAEMRGLLQYSYSGVFKQEHVSPKLTSSSFYDVVKGLSTTRMF